MAKKAARNPKAQDATLINIDALKRKLARAERVINAHGLRIAELEATVESLRDDAEAAEDARVELAGNAAPSLEDLTRFLLKR